MDPTCHNELFISTRDFLLVVNEVVDSKANKNQQDDSDDVKDPLR